MGYYTAYGLTMFGDEGQKNRVEKELLQASKDGAGRIDESMRELLHTGGTYAKLYDIETWINKVAPKFPDVLIILSGDGEDSDDHWEMRWKGKESEMQKAVIPPFTNENLHYPGEKD